MFKNTKDTKDCIKQGKKIICFKEALVYLVCVPFWNQNIFV